MAKLYHPDVYKGINQDHFKKVSEAYNTLKNPVKRSEYDRRQKIRSNQKNDDGRENDIFEKGQNPDTKVRETQDPEFEAAFRKLNTQRLFDQFMARPMRSDPGSL